MSKKSKLGILALVCVAAIIAIITTTQKEPYNTESVLSSLRDKYEDEIQSTQAPGGDFQVIDVSVYDEKDIDKVKNYLKNKLSKEDLKRYDLVIYEWNPDD